MQLLTERLRGPMVLSRLPGAPIATPSPGTPDLSGSSTGAPFSRAPAPAGRT